ncbi:TIGR02281 family clan AA aspartic protease [Algimonas porphyrae]|uniref:TIGR02281 family clan AA aspartic protease n=1 Tax=Algimonas porphyrae TaxID=1128113 RepID=A0ABQ5UYB2_9PROT|nr:TIGR02281 family clan AA aspartic protease [Algimonas porphyrae]GLQ19553.1 hypothetical protein GCM10007854_05080 [Algimonas porphyrae]
MSTSFLIQAGFFTAIAVGGTYYLSQNPAVKSAMDETADPVVTVEAKPKSASVVSIPRQNGQFYTHSRVNRGSVRFLIDTGASAVALTLDDARRVGIDPRSLSYDRPVDTANGRTYAASVTLDEIRIGGIVVRDVKALVVKEGLHISLLGMTFLGELQKVEATPTQLILRR